MLKAMVAGALALVGVGSGAAVAQDMSYSAYDWTGLWIGAHLGGVSGKITGPYPGYTMAGVDAGVHAYYNFALHNNWIVGPYVAIPLVSATGSSGGIGFKTTWAAVGGLRVGYAADTIMPYVLAAGVVGGGQVSDGSSTGTATHSGFALGGGVDIAIHDKVSAGLRYAHLWLNDQHYPGSYPGPFGWSPDSFVFTLNVKLK